MRKMDLLCLFSMAGIALVVVAIMDYLIPKPWWLSYVVWFIVVIPFLQWYKTRWDVRFSNQKEPT